MSVAGRRQRPHRPKVAHRYDPIAADTPRSDDRCHYCGHRIKAGAVTCEYCRDLPGAEPL